MRELHAATESIDQAVRGLVDVQRFIVAAAARLMAAGASVPLDYVAGAQARVRAALGALLRARRTIDDYLESVGLSPAASTRLKAVTDPDVWTAPDLDSWARVSQALQSCLDRFAVFLPDPAEHRDEPTAAAGRAGSFCKALAELALVLVALANLVTGPVNYAVQSVARALRAPLVATGVDLARAAAAQAAGGNLPADVAGQLHSEELLKHALGDLTLGSMELKVTAFLLRLTGTVACLAADRPLTQCPCFPNLLADMGGGIIGSTPHR